MNRKPIRADAASAAQSAPNKSLLIVLVVGFAVLLVVILGCFGVGAAILVARRPGGLTSPGEVVPANQRRPLREWIVGSWESIGPDQPYRKTDQPRDSKTTLGFRSDRAFTSSSEFKGMSQTISIIGTWEVKEESADNILIQVKPDPGTRPAGTNYGFPIQYLNENEFLIVDNIFNKDRLPAKYRRKR